MNSSELTKLIREIVTDIEYGNELTALKHIPKLESLGISANMHVGSPLFEKMNGKENKDLTEEERLLGLEWYAGSLIDIVDNEGWHVMNSFINSLDRFAPKDWIKG